LLDKLRKNIPLIIGGATIVGGLIGGINTAGRMVDTLTTIDARVSNLEELVADNEINNQIAILYEKIYQLEQVAYNAEYLEERVAYLDANYQNLEQEVRDLEWKVDDFQNRYISDLNNPSQDSQEYSLMKWEWQDLLKQVERVKTQQDLINQDWWKVEDNTLQIQNLWQQSHNH
jgi:septation ring formation regulator EzrA|tara:strand:- start:28460 stop:28981 length:522 start_codon:yes stop_codon:yes gene_type:complete